MKTAFAYIAFALATACIAGLAGMGVLIVALWRESTAQLPGAGPSMTRVGWILTALLAAGALGFLTLGLSLRNQPPSPSSEH